MIRYQKKKVAKDSTLPLSDVIGAIVIGISCIFLAWFCFSVVEVWIHNGTALSDQPYQYSDFNLFTLLLNR